MERVSDEWLDEAIPKYGAIYSRRKGGNVYLVLCELKERRRKESEAMREIEKLFESGVIKKVDDEILDALIAGQGSIIVGSWNAIMYALWELRARRKAEKEQGHTGHSASEKDGAGATQERERVILPAPVKRVDGVSVEKWAVKQWFQKINEELDELKAEALSAFYSLEVIPNDRPDLKNSEHDRMPEIAEEAADTITAITSMLEAMGITEQDRQEAQERVNQRNRERERL